MTTRILFVCLGNICRSPAAEGVMRQFAPKLELDSAGTSDWHVGEAPYGPMRAAAKARGFDLSPLRARQFQTNDFRDFDLIVAMDHSNQDRIEALRPAGNTTPVTLFAEYAEGWHASEVPDPYYTRDFDGVLDLIEDAARGLLARL
ncbi:low molecular weight protein-tyrosine-phosphatase [Thalassovita sp.]|uniref:low molecular weight protein-tyrosine-phosphatase n=1 Tax=Thalassovita sp. TaxID=1979401 RepID=UPI003B59E244